MPPKLERQASVPLEYRQPVAEPRPYITREGGLRPDIAKYPYSPFANNGQGGALSGGILGIHVLLVRDVVGGGGIGDAPTTNEEGDLVLVH